MIGWRWLAGAQAGSLTGLVTAKPSSGALRSSASLGPLGALRGARGGGTGGSLALAAFTCYSRHSLHSLGGRVSAPAKQEFAPGAAQPSRAQPSRPSRSTGPTDGDMGFSLVPEACGRRWGPLLLALFLAASRGKVHRAWALGQSAGRDQRVGEWVAGQLGYPGRPLQPAGYPPSLSPQAGRQWDCLAGVRGVSAKCSGWVVGTSLCSDGRSSSCRSIFPAQGEGSFCRTGGGPVRTAPEF